MLEKLNGIVATQADTCIAACFSSRFPVNDPAEWCHSLNLVQREETDRHDLPTKLLKQAAAQIERDNDKGLMLGFIDESPEAGWQLPETAFDEAGLKYHDTSLDYRSPLPFPRDPEYNYRRRHEDQIQWLETPDLEILKELAEFGNQVYDGIIPNPKRDADRWRTRLEGGNQFVAFARSPEGKVTGLVELLYSEPPSCYVGDIMVSFRRMATGLAIELTRLAMKRAQDAGATEVRCHVADWNRASIRLIESFGITKRGSVKRFIRRFGPTCPNVEE